MSLGEKLYELRREKHLSQEEVAEVLNVTRQTVSKWETNQSTPDFDKIAPLCALYGISANELLTGEKPEEKETLKKEEQEEKKLENKRKKALGIGLSIFIYFIAIVWIMISIPVMRLNPIVSSAIFLLICGVATFIIVYSSIVYKEKKNKEEVENPTVKLRKQITEIASMITLVIYLFVSFATMAWHITWLLWIVYALIEEIIKLIFLLRGEKDEK